MDETVAILFTDIEGSSRLWEQHPDRMPALLARHDRLTHDAVESRHGIVVKTTGDGLLAAFEDAAAAIRAAIDIQRALADPAFSEEIVLRTRIGVHAGLVERRARDLFGPAVNRAARMMATAHGGQILVSQAVVDVLAQRLPDAVSLRELGTVRLRDLARPERIWQVVHRDLRADFPALRSLESTPNNLPVQVTSFVGREREQAEVAALLRTSRLVTLIGTGGLGKSRLSLQVGAELLDRYPDGVWLVELASLDDGRLVAQAVAGALGVREDPGRPLTEALARFVSDRCLLLVLDNCEHMASACAELAETLLAAGPRVSILASSREHLRIPGETVYPLSTLALPEGDGADETAELPRYEAVRLFLDRALTVQPAFRLTDANARPVVEICRRLDGIPLALELAAARLRTLQVGDIAARLDDRFRLLKGGSRTAEPRQQTLEALIDWSHDLLSAKERALFRRLAVFAGGWTLAAAESVGAQSEASTPDVVDDLSRLVEKSLVSFDPDTGRFRLLETVREYARQRLDESDDAAATRQRHLACYFELFKEAGRHIGGGARSREWLSTLDPSGRTSSPPMPFAAAELASTTASERWRSSTRAIHTGCAAASSKQGCASSAKPSRGRAQVAAPKPGATRFTPQVCSAALRGTTTARRSISKRANRSRWKSGSNAARPAGCSSSRSPFSDAAIGLRPANTASRRSRLRDGRETSCSSRARSATWARRIVSRASCRRPIRSSTNRLHLRSSCTTATSSR
jgi:predicted ATPase/class 3 adenylate cyclase